MSNIKCLLIKPHVEDPKDFKQQQEDLEQIVLPAMEQPGLPWAEAKVGARSVKELTPELIQEVYEADLVVVDANRYTGWGESFLSPYLCYLLGMRHSQGNRTLLVSSSADHLPASLRKCHTLTYTRTRPAAFTNAFRETAQALAADSDDPPDNPIQEHVQAKKLKAELKQARDEAQEKEQELNRLRSQGGKPDSSRIKFRPVG